MKLASPTFTPSPSLTSQPSPTWTPTPTATRTSTRQKTIIPTENICQSIINEDNNILLNGGFEIGSGLPCYWARDSYIQNNSAFFWDNTIKHSGNYSVKILLTVINDSRWIQIVKLKSDTRYKLSGYIKTENVALSPEATDFGANISLFGPQYNPVIGGKGFLGTNDWRYMELVFTTGQRTELTVAARLGYFSGQTTGTAWFDDLKLIQIS